MATQSTAPKTTAKPTTAPAQSAPKQESAASKASRNAPIDLSALTVSAAPRPTRVGGSGRKASDNSVAEKWLSESWAERKDGEKVGGGRSLTVPTAAAGTVVSRLRRAAKTLSLGLAVQVTENGDKANVNFAAKTPKQTKPKTTPATTAPANKS